MTEPVADSIIFVSTDDELDATMIDRAESLMQEIDHYRKLGLDYTAAHEFDMWDGKKNRLALEAIDITNILHDRFGLTFGMEHHPDYTVTVEFVNGQPSQVWGAD